MSYHTFNHLAQFIKGDDLAAKIGRGILSCDQWIENVGYITVLIILRLTANFVYVGKFRHVTDRRSEERR